MIDKIVVSADRKNGMVHFDDHSFSFYHSEGKVIELITEIMFNGHKIAVEDTEKIEIQLSFKMDEAA